MNARLLIVTFSLIPIFVMAQGPLSGFMPKKGQWDFASTVSQEHYDEFYGPEGILELRPLTQKSLSFFVEHGLDQKTSLVLTAPYISHDDNNKGFQDASLWLKYRNEYNEKSHGTFNFITAFGLSVPLSKYPNDNPAAIGRRASTIHGRLLWQYNANYGWFIHLQSGLDFQFSPEAVAAIPLLIRGGIGTKWLYADLWFEHFHSLNNTPIDGIQVAGLNSIWNKAGGTIYIPIKPWVGIFTGGAIILSGKNIGKGKRLNVGAVFRIVP